MRLRASLRLSDHGLPFLMGHPELTVATLRRLVTFG
ncbi:hypothetical protein OKW35_005577 [Paraburkholderia sp. MM5477-R1]